MNKQIYTNTNSNSYTAAKLNTSFTSAYGCTSSNYFYDLFGRRRMDFSFSLAFILAYLFEPLHITGDDERQ